MIYQFNHCFGFKPFITHMEATADMSGEAK